MSRTVAEIVSVGHTFLWRDLDDGVHFDGRICKVGTDSVYVEVEHSVGLPAENEEGVRLIVQVPARFLGVDES